jgi:hypothetical protein
MLARASCSRAANPQRGTPQSASRRLGRRSDAQPAQPADEYRDQSVTRSMRGIPRVSGSVPPGAVRPGKLPGAFSHHFSRFQGEPSHKATAYADGIVRSLDVPQSGDSRRDALHSCAGGNELRVNWESGRCSEQR